MEKSVSVRLILKMFCEYLTFNLPILFMLYTYINFIIDIQMKIILRSTSNITNLKQIIPKN